MDPHSQAPVVMTPPLPGPRASGWPRRLVLADGTTLLVRPLERADRAGLAAATERLSARSRYLRFATPKPHLSRRELDHLLDVDHHGREALLAIDPATREGVAVARYAELREAPGVVDVAVTVADAWQGRGIGTRLVSALLARACEEGHRAARATVLSENALSRSMVRGAGFRLRERDGIQLEYELELECAEPSASALHC